MSAMALHFYLLEISWFIFCKGEKKKYKKGKWVIFVLTDGGRPCSLPSLSLLPSPPLTVDICKGRLCGRPYAVT